MNKRSPRCVLISYDEDEQAIQTCTIDRSLVDKLIQAALTVPWPLENQDFILGDEFARQIGGVALLLLAQTQPELAPYINVTRNSEPPPTD
jgi:hypothetical protein